MAIALVPYLNFAGNTAEAMRYYQGIFGGRVEIATFADFGVEGMPADGTMHASLEGGHFNLMASDAMGGAEATWGTTRVYLSLAGDELGLLTGWFDRLAADGTVSQPLAKQVWGDVYGMLTDKFGLEWMFNISDTERAAHPD